MDEIKIRNVSRKVRCLQNSRIFEDIIKNPKQPIIRKYTYWLESPDGKGQSFDSPSTIGEKCPIQQLFYKLNKSESAADRRMAEKLKRREQFYSLIKVIKDPVISFGTPLIIVLFVAVAIFTPVLKICCTPVLSIRAKAVKPIQTKIKLKIIIIAVAVFFILDRFF